MHVFPRRSILLPLKHLLTLILQFNISILFYCRTKKQFFGTIAMCHQKDLAFKLQTLRLSPNSIYFHIL